MPMVDMRAVKPLKYRTRRLKPGDDFRVKSEQEARVLIALSRAERVRNPNPRVALDDAREAVGMKPVAPDTAGIAAVRQEYAAKFGKRAFNGWSVEQLREKIAAA